MSKISNKSNEQNDKSKSKLEPSSAGKQVVYSYEPEVDLPPKKDRPEYSHRMRGDDQSHATWEGKKVHFNDELHAIQKDFLNEMKRKPKRVRAIKAQAVIEPTFSTELNQVVNNSSTYLSNSAKTHTATGEVIKKSIKDNIRTF